MACRKQRNLMGIVTSGLISTIELSDDLNSSKFEYLNNYKITCPVRLLILSHILFVLFLFFNLSHILFVLFLFFFIIIRSFLLFLLFFRILIFLLLCRRFCGSPSIFARARSTWPPAPSVDETSTSSADSRSLKNSAHVIVRVSRHSRAGSSMPILFEIIRKIYSLDLHFISFRRNLIHSWIPRNSRIECRMLLNVGTRKGRQVDGIWIHRGNTRNNQSTFIVIEGKIQGCFLSSARVLFYVSHHRISSPMYNVTGRSTGSKQHRVLRVRFPRFRDKDIDIHPCILELGQSNDFSFVNLPFGRRDWITWIEVPSLVSFHRSKPSLVWIMGRRMVQKGFGHPLQSFENLHPDIVVVRTQMAFVFSFARFTAKFMDLSRSQVEFQPHGPFQMVFEGISDLFVLNPVSLHQFWKCLFIVACVDEDRVVHMGCQHIRHRPFLLARILNSLWKILCLLLFVVG